MTKEQGIVLLAFGKSGYFYAAHNIAFSIKHFNPDINIALIYNGNLNILNGNTYFFDELIPLKDEDVYTNYKIDPAKAKIAIYDYLPYKENLYLDVDGLVLKDIEPLFKQLSEQKEDYITDVLGIGGEKDTINYNVWAKNSDIWDFFNLKEDSLFPAIQSSYAFIRKSTKSKKFFDTAKKFFDKGFDLKKLTMNWGGTLPDELIFSGTCAKLGINPSAKLANRPIFFGWKHTNLQFSEIIEKHYITSIYGNGKGKSLVKPVYLKWYDRLLFKYSREQRTPFYKNAYIMRDKHTNNRK